MIVYRADEQFVATNDKAKMFKEAIPPGTCTQDIYERCYTDIQQVVTFVDSQPIDVIIQYGLGRGLLWEQDEFKGIPCINDDHTFRELLEKKVINDETGELSDKIVLHYDVRPKIVALFEKLDSDKCWPLKVCIAKTREDLAYIVERCKRESFGLDTETNHLNSFIRNPKPILAGFSVAWHSDEEEGWWISTTQKLIDEGELEYTVEEGLACAEAVFFESDKPQDWQNYHYDGIVLWELFGRKPKNFRCDTMLLLSLWHKAMSSAALANNVGLVGLPMYKDACKDWIASQPKKKKGQDPYTFADVPLPIIGPYGAVDAIAVVRFFNFMKKNLSREQWTFYFDIAHPVLLASVELCEEGYEISRDRYYFTKLTAEKQIHKSFKEAIDVVKDHVDAQFNINSNTQLADLLFNKLKMPSLQKTEGGAAACGSKVLDDLILFHPFIFYLLKVKKLAKLYSSYVQGYTNVLGPGSKWFETNGSEWIINAQLRQINRTARLSATNMNGHKGTKKKGGNVLVLPGTGAMIKHYFGPKEVLSLENEIYADIMSELEQSDPDKYAEVMSNLSQDATKEIKPAKVPKPKKERKPAKSKKGKTATATVEAEIVSLDEIDQEELTEDFELPWN